MKIKKDNIINSIQGNFLASKNIILIYEIIKRNHESKPNCEDCYLIIKRKSIDRFAAFVVYDDQKKLLNFKKTEWAINTIWYWLIGYYILNIIDREVTTKELKSIDASNTYEIKIKINCNVLFDIFNDLNVENMSAFNLSQYISNHKNDSGTFLNMLYSENIGNNEKSFLYKLYYRYQYQDKLFNNKRILNDELNNFLNILVDGITGKINKKDKLIEIIQSVHKELNNYKYIFDMKSNIFEDTGDINYTYKLNIYKSHIEIIKEKLIKILKKDFRKTLIKSRKEEKSYINNDLYLNLNNEKTIISPNNPTWYIEATHIVPVENIVESLIEKYINEPNNFSEEVYYDEKIEKYTNPKNGLLLPFNYRQFWNKNYFYFDVNGKICFDEKNRKLLESFKIDCDARLNIEIDSEIKKLIQERNDVFNKI